MNLLHVSALSADDLDRIRHRGVDDFGNPLVVTINQDPGGGGAPLRCCLRDAAVGDRVALLAWQPSPHPGAYAEVGPVFVHAEACAGWTGRGYPEGFRGRRQLLRSYDGGGRVVDNEIVDGGEAAETALDVLLDRPDVAYVHARNVLAGCYMFQIQRESTVLITEPEDREPSGSR